MSLRARSPRPARQLRRRRRPAAPRSARTRTSAVTWPIATAQRLVSVREDDKSTGQVAYSPFHSPFTTTQPAPEPARSALRTEALAGVVDPPLDMGPGAEAQVAGVGANAVLVGIHPGPDARLEFGEDAVGLDPPARDQWPEAVPVEPLGVQPLEPPGPAPLYPVVPEPRRPELADDRGGAACAAEAARSWASRPCAIPSAAVGGAPRCVLPSRRHRATQSRTDRRRRDTAG